MKLPRVTSLLALSAFLHVAVCSPAANVLPTVTIASGVIVGTTSLIPTATAVVNKYLGIPFAQSPPLRFAPPVEPAKWTQPLQAMTLRDACMQQFVYPLDEREKAIAIFNNFYGGQDIGESEDCMYLNVWTPSKVTPASKLPVMFWIYGGNFEFGTGAIAPYDGSSFAYNQNVIIVTFNWRANVFGFSNSPELPLTSRNAGLLDQRMALKWVQNNIAAFGGDPAKVTIFGESSGGYCIKHLLASPPSPLPFRAAIISSESAFFTGNSTMNWESLVLALNCSKKASPINCVRKVDPVIIKYFIEFNAQNYSPVIDNVTRVADLRTALESGTAVKVPIMIGTNTNEARPFAYVLGFDNQSMNVTNFLEMLFPNNTIIQAAIEALFPVTQIPFVSISQIMTDLTFTCTASAIASAAQAAGYQIWRYFYDSTFPNLQPFRNAGVWHSSEIPIVFGTYPLYNVTAQQVALSKYIQTAWATFAKNPSGGPGWLPYGAFGNVGRLGGDTNFTGGASGETTVLASTIDAPCLVYGPLVAAQPL